jgi:hypothetical protein
MPYKIEDAATRYALAMSGLKLEPEDLAGPVKVEDRQTKDRYAQIAEVMSTIEKVVGKEGSSVRIFMGIDDLIDSLNPIGVAQKWSTDLLIHLRVMVGKETSDLMMIKNYSADLTERMKELTLGDIPEVILHEDSQKLRLMAATVGPALVGIYEPDKFDFVFSMMNSLRGVMINRYEPPLLRLVCTHSLTEVMVSDFQFSLSEENLDHVARAYLLLARHSDKPFLREAAISSMGILCANWPTRIGSRSALADEVAKHIENGETNSIKHAAVKAYGVMYANLFVDEDKVHKVVEPLKRLADKRSLGALSEDARTLLKILDRGSSAGGGINEPGVSSAPVGSNGSNGSSFKSLVRRISTAARRISIHPVWSRNRFLPR